MKGELRAAAAPVFTNSYYRHMQIRFLLRSKRATSPLRKPTCELYLEKQPLFFVMAVRKYTLWPQYEES